MNAVILGMYVDMEGNAVGTITDGHVKCVVKKGKEFVTAWEAEYEVQDLMNIKLSNGKQIEILLNAEEKRLERLIVTSEGQDKVAWAPATETAKTRENDNREEVAEEAS